MPRAWIFWAALVVLVLAAIEGLSFWSLHIVERARPGTVLDLFLRDHFARLTREDIERFRTKAFDPVLGWSHRPLTTLEAVNSAGQPYQMRYDADGARADGLSSRQPLVSTYGDSFTAGDEVNDDATWPFFLQSLLDADVRNFGNNAYGTDQSVLQLEQHADAQGLAPIVVLGVMSENINRIVNVFRPFYFPTTEYKLGFKPRYRCDTSGSVALVPNPMQEFESAPEKLQALATEAARSDPYAQSKLRLTWPFTLNMIKLLYEYGSARLGKRSWLFPDRASFDLWSDPASTHLMRCILARFVALARAGGAVPVLVFLPRAEHAHAPPYRDLVARLRQSLPEVAIVDIAEEQLDPRRFGVRPDGGHPSAYGNRIIARAVDRAIQSIEQRGLEAPDGARDHGPE